MKTTSRRPEEKEQWIIDTLQVRPIRPCERVRCMRLLAAHHYLGDIQPVGEQMIYVAVSPCGGWRGILVFCAAALHLKAREAWIGWTNEQRRRRLALVANNARFLILPGYSIPNLATRMLSLALDRLADDWAKQYGHPVALVETFVDPEQFQGTIYKAGNWVELGTTRGCGRIGKDYYVRHNKPKRLYVRELFRNARRGLQAEHLKPGWRMVEEKVAPRCTLPVKELRSLIEGLKKVPDYRSRIGSYPIWSLLGIVALAPICGVLGGQKGLVKFARQLNDGQRHALGIRRNRNGRCPAPSQPTFCRLLKAVDARAVEAVILDFQTQLRGPSPKDEVVAVDGKAARRSQGEMLLNAVAVPSLYYLGSEPVPVDKTNEIPVARALLERLDLEGRLVGMDALHTQSDTARALVQEAGGDYLMTIKDNQKVLRKTAQTLMAATPAAFSPSAHHADPGVERRTQQESSGATTNPHTGDNARTNVLPTCRAGSTDVSPYWIAQAGNGLAADQPETRTTECVPVASGSTRLLGH